MSDAKAPRITEDQLCSAFAEATKLSSAFRSWLIGRTKFAAHAASAILLHEEQMALRPRKFWWRHWWCHVPELKRDRETDIFMVFQDPSGGRFALHIENKLRQGRFAPGQAEGYRPRAIHMSNQSKYLSYTDFQTILICPETFQARYPDECRLFDAYISFEEIAAFVPAFELAERFQRRMPPNSRRRT
jgi:hypothetical protein